MNDLSDLIGLRLHDARAALTGHQIVEVETQAKPSRASVPVWGEMRVLRARRVASNDDAPVVELLIARELLRDERAD